jgi:hypothetical protein
MTEATATAPTAAGAPEFNARSIGIVVAFTVFGGGLMGWGLKQTTMEDPRRDAELQFTKRHPCPVNGSTRGECPGYVISLIKPACAGGGERPGNLQWQTVAAARKKERVDAAECRKQTKQRTTK